MHASLAPQHEVVVFQQVRPHPANELDFEDGMKTSTANWGAPADVLARLEGDWTIVRHVDGQHLLKGIATFSANGDGSLTYHERGRVHLADGQEFEAERRYLYRASPGGFAVFFFEEPARLFHEIRLEEAHGGMMSEASHLCKEDLYRSRYVFLADGTFLIRHEVSGPRKSFTLETLYDRDHRPDREAMRLEG